MTDSTTPVCDLIERLVSRGMSTGDALAEARPVETAIASRRGSSPEQRERWRLKKERQRAAKAGSPPGDKIVPLESSTSKTQNKLKKESKKDSSPLLSLGDNDGWPDDYEKQFWESFPKKRRGDRPQVFKLLAKMRKDKTVEWSKLIEAVVAYAASDLGDDDQYAKAPLPWLRGHRWEITYQPKRGGPNAKSGNNGGGGVGFAGISAALRAKRTGPARGPQQPPAGDEPRD